MNLKHKHKEPMRPVGGRGVTPAGVGFIGVCFRAAAAIVLTIGAWVNGSLLVNLFSA